MAEYIERGAFLKDVEERNCLPCRRARQARGGSLCEICWVNDLRNEIINAPTADVAQVVHGRWETNSDRPDTLICSVCKCWFDMWKHDPHNYCPNCGSKMDLEALQ